MGSLHSSKICRQASDWFRGISYWLCGEETSFASIQTLAGSISYDKLKSLKVRDGCCNLHKWGIQLDYIESEEFHGIDGLPWLDSCNS